jgi:hypothetical protein
VNGWVVVFWNKWKRVIYRYICERRLGHVGITPIYGGDTFCHLSISKCQLQKYTIEQCSKEKVPMILS